MEVHLSLLMLILASSHATNWLNPDNRICNGWGDPHYITFDRQDIHFQGVCRYLLAGTCTEFYELEPFKIYVENELLIHRPGTAITKLVDIHFRNWIILFTQNQVVKVKGPSSPWSTLSMFPHSITGVGGIDVPSPNNMIFFGANGIEVQYSDDRHVRVTVPPGYEDMMCGICGNNNGVSSDDLVTSYGMIVSDSQAGHDLIGHSWEVNPVPWSISPCHKLPGVVLGDLNGISTPCDELRWLIELLHCVEVFEDVFEAYHSACVYDYVVLGSTDGHCMTFQAVVEMCEFLTGQDYSSNPSIWRELVGCSCPDGSFIDPCPSDDRQRDEN